MDQNINKYNYLSNCLKLYTLIENDVHVHIKQEETEHVKCAGLELACVLIPSFTT